jgi:tRNA threonylcarbamoyladenosine biosynthesis protein TsaE
MSTARTWQTTSTGLESTLELAALVGSKLRGGEVIVLVSDLGGGKTAFVRGLVQGMGSTDTVHSPSFTLSNQYRAGKLTLYHFDFYRLDEPGIMRQELAEILEDTQAVVAIEWANIVENVLPERRLTIHFSATGETKRELAFEYPEELQYLLPQINT